MTAPTRIQLRRTAGWRMPPGAVKVDRRTRWGNPFDLRSPDHCWTALAHGFTGDPAGRRAASVAMFRAWVLKGQAFTVTGCGLYCTSTDATGEESRIMVGGPSADIVAPTPPALDEIRDALAGRDLACWCAPDLPCHADVLLELANAETQQR